MFKIYDFLRLYEKCIFGVQEWDFVLINSENSAKIKKRSF